MFLYVEQDQLQFTHRAAGGAVPVAQADPAVQINVLIGPVEQEEQRREASSL